MAKDERYYRAYLNHQTISRRGLLRACFSSHNEENAGQVGKLPFACSREIFTALCDGCGACINACPWGLIVKQEKQVVLDLTLAPCDLCGYCATACPKQLLHPAFGADTHFRPTFSNHCLVQQGQTCTVCQQACPQQAISSHLALDPNACNGCGVCQHACFVGAIGLQ